MRDAIYLMLVICMPGQNQCTVEWSRQVYQTTNECVAAAPLARRKRGVIVEGVYCEMSDAEPETYAIAKDEIPH